MSRISKADRQLQLQREEAGEHLYANRVRVYPKSVHGPVRRFKWAILIACLSLYYLLPWLRWHRGVSQPSQAVLLDLSHERFYFFNLEFWPQDIYYLTGLLIIGAVALFLVTSLIGRVWCGYTCPQTVWTDLFMWVERLLEGDRNERMRRDAETLTFDAAWRKGAKHAIWLGIAFWTGGAWIMYYVDAPTVTVEFWTGTASREVYFFTALFTATTYLLAGWAREQVCTYMCPWPRFQSAMLDEQSVTVTYQGWRGEPRVRGKRHEDTPAGDCIDCGACVTACPTGIDIRDGIQLECINCGLCVDACNHVMEKTGRPKWLITWDTLADQSAKAAGQQTTLHLLRPRTLIYISAMLVVVIVMTVALLTRATFGLSVLHDRAPLFVRLPDGGLRNGYTVKIVNKSQVQTLFVLSSAGIPGGILTEADEGLGPADTLGLPVKADSVGTFRVLLSGQPDRLVDGSQPVEFSLLNAQTGEEAQYRSVFMGPR
ncbi:MAG TPA: cytochrome c oxidase accessory protein CcoG [Acetobacteraceae bacterium]|jgi:cytochrome c oxidase accessory protein FixG|nr:cytochrome c oxidase accessory protein CcoG [Acetobacteraceae bacterium]